MTRVVGETTRLVHGRGTGGNHPTGEYALPDDALTLTEAFETVFEATESNPAKMQEVYDEWLSGHRNIREFVTAGKIELQRIRSRA